MKFIFLDIDGVMNNTFYLSREGRDCIADEFLLILKSIVNQTQAKIVLSSTWRVKQIDKDMVINALARHGMELFSATPELKTSFRHVEIDDWLLNNLDSDELNTCQYAIIDDDELAGVGHAESFFVTNFDVGLTPKIGEAVVKHLNKEIK